MLPQYLMGDGGTRVTFAVCSGAMGFGDLQLPDIQKLVPRASELDLTYAPGLPAAVRMKFKPKKEWISASVCILFAHSESDGSLKLLLTKRSESLRAHRGQIAFPGGKVDQGESAEEAAVRETEEEVGLDRRQIVPLASLPNIPTFANDYLVTPIVSYLIGPCSEDILRVNPSEIASAKWVAWNELVNPSNFDREWIEGRLGRFLGPVFYLNDYRVWGATAVMLKNLVDRLEQAFEES